MVGTDRQSELRKALGTHSEYGQIGTSQLKLATCSNCGVPNPVLNSVWQSQHALPRGDGEAPLLWQVFSCTTCSHLIVAQGGPASLSNPPILRVYPEPRRAHADLPPVARAFLEQAYRTLHAPDAAAVMAGSAVDAMLKVLGYRDGSVYTRIDTAKRDGKLTEGMAEWAHHVRLGSNRPRHADENEPHVTPDEAKLSVEFAEALGEFLFVLTAQINRGIEAAEATGDSA